MEEDLVFNFDEINVTEETADIINQDEKEEKIDKIEVEDTTIKTDENKEIEETKEKTEEAPASEADSSQQSTLYALAKYLKDEGALFLDDELKKVDTIDELKTLIQESHNKAKYSNMSETQQRYLDALENGVPIKDYETVEKDIQTFQNIKPEAIAEDQQLQYELIAIDFMNQGVEKEKAMTLAELSVKQESSNSVTDAEQALKNILEHKVSKYNELVDSKKKQTDLDLGEIKKSLDDRKEILTMEVNDITKNELFDLMTTKVASDDNGLPLNKLQKFQRDNPIEANILMNYLFMVTNEGKDLGLIKTNTTSSAAKELEKKLKQMNFDNDGSLIIPEEMFSKKDNSNTNKNNLTINI